jgi:ATP-dependent Lon protease
MAIVLKKTEAPETARPEVSNPTAWPLVALREGVVFPHTELVLVFNRPQSKAAVAAAEANQGFLLVLSQKDGDRDNVRPHDLYRVGTLVQIERTMSSDDEVHVLMRGLKRMAILEFTKTKPYFQATATELSEQLTEDDTFHAQLNLLSNRFKQSIQSGKPIDFMNFMKMVGSTKTPDLVDHVAATLDIPTNVKQPLLEELDINKRIDAVLELLSQEQRVLDLEQNLAQKTKKQLDERMRENILRERMQVIQKELGELDDEEDLNELEQQIRKAKFPPKIAQKVEKDFKRLSQMSPMHAEYAYLRTWLETVLELPWNKKSRERHSLPRAAQILNQQHYGLEKVKERILEHLAVLQWRAKEKDESKDAPTKVIKGHRNGSLSTILCFVGPPGVGKTSIGRSIAEALGREFVKVSLGGVHDEAEIRGHRRTYIGAMTGRIMQGMAQVKTKNPVFMLDEIDKLGNDFRGDPSSALLEALDPEQNFEFTDHYLDLPFDLSEVMFITTANVLHSIPEPLQDRLELVEYTGYTQDEKFHIAKDYLIDQVITGTGLHKKQLKISASALRQVIQYYTREAGVRSLKRELAKIARKVARQLAENQELSGVAVTPKNLDTFLGPPKVLDTIQEKQPEIGLVNGLAWTSVGGELLPIEAALIPGKEGFLLTGQLGKVMQESARAAFTFVRSQAKSFNIDPKVFSKNQVHIHIPEGAVPKDGPSAGVAMAVVLTSVFSGRAVRSDVAMTGEITLRGRSLPIGGLKEKMIAAHRAGMKTVYIPHQNNKDLVEIPDKVKKDIKIIPVEFARDVIEQVLLPVAVPPTDDLYKQRAS